MKNGPQWGVGSYRSLQEVVLEAFATDSSSLSLIRSISLYCKLFFVSWNWCSTVSQSMAMRPVFSSWGLLHSTAASWPLSCRWLTPAKPFLFQHMFHQKRLWSLLDSSISHRRGICRVTPFDFFFFCVCVCELLGMLPTSGVNFLSVVPLQIF